MGTTPVVAGVLAQLQKLLDVEVPGLQIGTDCALALAALVDRHCGVVDNLQERHDTLALAVGALDVAAQRTHSCPVVAQATGELAQQRVFLQRFIDAVQVVGHRGEVATRQLRAQRTGVEKRGRARHEVEARQHVVELDRSRLAVDLAQRQTHRHAHEEGLRHLDAKFIDVQEVAVEQGLQAEVIELQIALGLECSAQTGHVVLLQTRIQQFGLNPTLDELREIVWVAHSHLGLAEFFAEDFLADGVQQQARGGSGVGRLLLDQRARGQDAGLVHFVDRHAVVQVAPCLGQDRVGLDIGAQPLTSRYDQRLQGAEVQRHTLATVDHVQQRCLRRCRLDLTCALLGAALAVQDIGPCHLVMAAPHQPKLDLVLHILDVKSAAARTRTQQATHHTLGQRVDGLSHAGRGRTLGAMHSQECLHQRHSDLVGLESHDRTVAPDDLETGIGRRGNAALGWRAGRDHGS